MAIKETERGVTRSTLSPDFTLDEVDRQRTIGRLSRPNPNYLKSKEGIEEYKKVGLQYPENAHDKHWNGVLERTPDGEGNQYAHKNKTRVTGITRRRLASGKEYLTWHQTEIRYTPLGDPEYKSRTNLGKYPIIEYKHAMKEEKSGYRHPVTQPTGNTKIGYSLPYTVENIDRLHQNAVDGYQFEEAINIDMRPTSYALLDERKHMVYSIKNWEDFRDGSFEDLYEHGRKTESDEERKAIKENIQKQMQQVEQQKLETLKRGL
jgi:hypothetical protein